MANSDRRLKVCIFGEDGLLARAISDSLEQKYEMINSYSHLAEEARSYLSSFSWVPEIDATNSDLVRSLVSKADVVINCTGLVNTDKCSADIYGAYRANVLTAKVITDACLEFDKYLVHLATTASYGSNHLILEDDEPSMFQTIYSGSKLLGESIARKYENTLIIRPCFIYGGRRDTSSVLKKLIERALTNDHPYWEITLSLQTRKDYLWVFDFSEALRSLLERGRTGVYNISGGKPREYNQILKILENNGLKVKNVVWKEDLDYLGNHLVSNQKLVLDTGWAPKVSLEEGVKNIINEYA